MTGTDKGIHSIMHDVDHITTLDNSSPFSYFNLFHSSLLMVHDSKLVLLDIRPCFLPPPPASRSLTSSNNICLHTVARGLSGRLFAKSILI